MFRAAVKAYHEWQKNTVNLYRRGKYNVKEPKTTVKVQVAKELQQKLFSVPSVRTALRFTFKNVHESVAKLIQSHVEQFSLQNCSETAATVCLKEAERKCRLAVKECLNSE